MNSLSRICAAGSLAAASLLSSCAYPYVGPNQATGSVLGAATGAVAGGIIGHQSGRGLEGAAIGGLLGSWAGGSLGYSQDVYQYGGYARPAPAYYRPYRYGAPRYYDPGPPVFPINSYHCGW